MLFEVSASRSTLRSTSLGASSESHDSWTRRVSLNLSLRTSRVTALIIFITYISYLMFPWRTLPRFFVSRAPQAHLTKRRALNTHEGLKRPFLDSIRLHTDQPDPA